MRPLRWIPFLILPFLAALPWSCGSSGPTSPAPTATPVPVFTNTPCQNGGTPCTSTATFTPTNTSTPTATPTDTDSPTPTDSPTITQTFCPTQTFSPTPVSGSNSFSGTINYTGGTVDSNHPLGVLAVNISGSGEPAFRFLATNGGSYTLDGLSAGATYILSFWYNTTGDGTAFPQPHIGDYVGAYGSASCAVSTWAFLIAGGTQTGINANFDTSKQLYGVAGSVTYAGSFGNVDGCHSLVIQLWPTGTTLYGASGSVTCSLCTPLSNKYFNSNGVSYNEVAFSYAANVCVSDNVDVLAFYQKPGTPCCSIEPGDPYVFLTNVATSNSPTQNLTISDSTTY